MSTLHPRRRGLFGTDAGERAVAAEPCALPPGTRCGPEWRAFAGPTGFLRHPAALPATGGFASPLRPAGGDARVQPPGPPACQAAAHPPAVASPVASATQPPQALAQAAPVRALHPIFDAAALDGQVLTPQPLPRPQPQQRPRLGSFYQARPVAVRPAALRPSAYAGLLLTMAAVAFGASLVGGLLLEPGPAAAPARAEPALATAALPAPLLADLAPAFSTPAFSAPAFSAPAFSAPAFSAPAHPAPSYKGPTGASRTPAIVRLHPSRDVELTAVSSTARPNGWCQPEAGQPPRQSPACPAEPASPPAPPAEPPHPTAKQASKHAAPGRWAELAKPGAPLLFVATAAPAP